MINRFTTFEISWSSKKTHTFFLSLHNPHLWNGQCDLLRVTDGILAVFFVLFFRATKGETKSRSLSDGCFYQLELVYIGTIELNVSMLIHEESSCNWSREASIIFRSKIEICGSASRRMRLRKQRPANTRVAACPKRRRRVPWSTIQLAVDVDSEPMPDFYCAITFLTQCHNMTHIANILYLENQIVRF